MLLDIMMFREYSVYFCTKHWNRPIHLDLLMTWKSCPPEGKCFNVLLNMLRLTESQWWIFVFPMLWKEAEIVNLDVHLDRIDKCHGLVKNNSECFQEAISREYWHVSYQGRGKDLPWLWLNHLTVLMWREWAITLNREENVLTWTRLSSPLRNFLPSLQITVLCLAMLGGLIPLKLWIKIRPSSPQLSCSVFPWRHTTVGASKSSSVRQKVTAYIKSMGERMLRSVGITWTWAPFGLYKDLQYSQPHDPEYVQDSIKLGVQAIIIDS